MTAATRQIFAFSGILSSERTTRTNAGLTDYAVALSGRESGQRVCYVPTAVGDSLAAVEATSKEFAERRPDVEFSVLTLFTQPSVPEMRHHLVAQDVILVEGGSVANLMVLWRLHGLDVIMRECWAAGVVLAGGSAGSLCWHTGGPTDSFGDELAPFRDGLGLLPFSNGVHDDFGDQPRRRIYRDMVANGTLHAGYATEDGVGLHYVGTTLHEAVSIRSTAAAWWVGPDGRGGFREERVATRYI